MFVRSDNRATELAFVLSCVQISVYIKGESLLNTSWRRKVTLQPDQERVPILKFK